jgi:2-methylcitrate dehydratase PrpD
MAAKGMTGPRTVFEGRYGLYNTHLVGIPSSVMRVVRGLGEVWELQNTTFKPYPCGVVLHPFLRCVEDVLSQNRISHQEIEEIECTVPTGMVPLVCEPLSQKVAPRTAYDAKFSLPFAVSAMIVDGRIDTTTFTEGKVAEESILRLARRVRYVPIEGTGYPKTIPARIVMRMKDGRTYAAAMDTNPGGPRFPMTKEEHFAKFVSNASAFLGERKAERLLRELDDLESIQSVKRLMRLCA